MARGHVGSRQRRSASDSPQPRTAEHPCDPTLDASAQGSETVPSEGCHRRKEASARLGMRHGAQSAHDVVFCGKTVATAGGGCAFGKTWRVSNFGGRRTYDRRTVRAAHHGSDARYAKPSAACFRQGHGPAVCRCAVCDWTPARPASRTQPRCAILCSYSTIADFTG